MEMETYLNISTGEFNLSSIPDFEQMLTKITPTKFGFVQNWNIIHMTKKDLLFKFLIFLKIPHHPSNLMAISAFNKNTNFVYEFNATDLNGDNYFIQFLMVRMLTSSV